MIEKTDNGYEVFCDRCSTEFLDVDSPEHQWGDVMSEMATEGWVSVKNRRGEWEHFCRSCKLQRTG